VFSIGKTPRVSGFCATYSTTCLIVVNGVVKQFRLCALQNSSVAIEEKDVSGSKYAIFFIDSKLSIYITASFY
jgi:hypothetical protein